MIALIFSLAGCHRRCRRPRHYLRLRRCRHTGAPPREGRPPTISDEPRIHHASRPTTPFWHASMKKAMRYHDCCYFPMPCCFSVLPPYAFTPAAYSAAPSSPDAAWRRHRRHIADMLSAVSDGGAQCGLRRCAERMQRAALPLMRDSHVYRCRATYRCHHTR